MTILTENLPPLNYVEDGVLVGPSVEIVREIQRRVGSNEQIEVYPWARAYKMALEEENVVLFSMSSVCELPSMIQGSRRQIGRPLKRS